MVELMTEERKIRGDVEIIMRTWDFRELGVPVDIPFPIWLV